MNVEKIGVKNIGKNQSIFDFECFILCTSKSGKTFVRELTNSASHYFDNKNDIRKAMDLFDSWHI